MTKTILVTAANGTVGRHLVNRLLALGHAVRAGSRRGEAAAGQPVRLDFADPATYAAALDGVDAAYLVVPTGAHHPREALGPFVAAAAERGTKLVLQSAIGVEASEEIPFRQLELAIERSGAPFVLLRPNWFSDNFHTYWLKGIRDEGAIVLPAAEARTSFIDARDIADAAVAALTTDRFDGRAFTLTGGEGLTYAEAARVLAAVSGRPVSYRPVDPEEFIAFAPRTGLSEDYARHLAPIFHPVAQGWVGADSGDVARLTGRPPRRFLDYAADHAAQFR